MKELFQRYFQSLVGKISPPQPQRTWDDHIREIQNSDLPFPDKAFGIVDAIVDMNLGKEAPKAEDKQLRKGVMVALEVPAEKLPEGVTDPHLTLLYLGKVDTIDPDLLESFKTGLEDIARHWSPFELELTGQGQFQSTREDKWVDYISASSPALPGLRQQIVDTAILCGLDVSRKWGFTPHVTVKYVDQGTPMGSYDFDREPFSIGHIGLWVASEKHLFPLSGERSFGMGDEVFGKFKDHPDKYRLEKDHRWHRIGEIAEKLPELTRTAEERQELGAHITHHLHESLILPAEYVIPKTGMGELGKFQMFHGYTLSQTYQPEGRIARSEVGFHPINKEVDKDPEKHNIHVLSHGRVSAGPFRGKKLGWRWVMGATGCDNPVEYRRRMLGNHPLIDHQQSEMQISYDEGSFLSQIELRSIHGEHMGHMTRRHMGEPDPITGWDFKPGSVHNDHFELSPEFQGLGIGESIYQSQEEAFKVAGYDYVNLSANISVGGYAWARQGYDFRYEQEMRNVLDRMDQQFHLMPDSWKDENLSQHEENMRKMRQHGAAAYEIAAYRIGDEAIGKRALLGSTWSGEKRLSDNWRGNAAANLSRARLFGIPVRREE